jgi:hopene-associated glycosyltransferase HpnB
MTLLVTAIAVLSLTVWLYLVVLRGGFWRTDQRLGEDFSAPEAWPAVVALVPARNEAAVIGRSVASLLAQDYPGRFQVVVTDDHSTDGTAEAVSAAAQVSAHADRLTVVATGALPAGWSGKLWALNEGLAHAGKLALDAPYLWLSDADIAHEPDTLSRLVAKAESQNLNLVSLMATLSCRGFWERLLIPPFVYFFQMLYPFAWVNDLQNRTAAAAGGCVLLRRGALDRAGGFAGATARSSTTAPWRGGSRIFRRRTERAVRGPLGSGSAWPPHRGASAGTGAWAISGAWLHAAPTRSFATRRSSSPAHLPAWR